MPFVDRLLSACTGLLCSALLFFGCRQSSPEGEIVLAAPRDLSPGVLDPYYCSSILHVWEPLIGRGYDGHPKPRLAESWDSTSSGQEWVLHLRQGVRFHNGDTLTADMVSANLHRLKNMGLKPSLFYTYDFATFFPNLESWETAGTLSLRLRFSKPCPTFPYLIAGWPSAIFHPSGFDSLGNFTGTPIATGPYRLISHRAQVETLLEPHPYPYDEKRATERLRIRVLPDPNARYSALLSGEIHGVIDLGAIPPRLANTLEKKEGFEKSSHASTISHYLMPNGSIPPFDDPVFRRALSLAIDRERIASTLFAGEAEPAYSVLNPASAFAVKGDAYCDPQEAGRIFKSLGVDKLPELKFLVPSYGTDRYPYLALAEYLQSVLEDFGIKSSISILDGASYRAVQSRGEYHMALSTSGLPSADPQVWLRQYLHSRGAANARNGLGFSHEEADALFSELEAELDPDRRAVIYARLQEIALDELPVIPLLHDKNVVVSSKRIQGHIATPYGTTLPDLRWAP